MGESDLKAEGKGAHVVASHVAQLLPLFESNKFESTRRGEGGTLWREGNEDVDLSVTDGMGRW